MRLGNAERLEVGAISERCEYLRLVLCPDRPQGIRIGTTISKSGAVLQQQQRLTGRSDYAIIHSSKNSFVRIMKLIYTKVAKLTEITMASISGISCMSHGGAKIIKC